MAFPSYREHGVAWCRGLDPLRLLELFRGVNHGGWDPEEHKFHLYTIVIGDQTLHATGYAMGIKRDGAEDEAVIAYFGDGATSQGDVSEAFAWASVFNAPVVFFCQNNQWAISAPPERQSRVPIYQRASGFGFPGVRVDGNDVLACYAVTKQALRAAREGQGPTLIEAFTYRMGAHTTTDDPTRYRLAERARGLAAAGPDRARPGLPGPHRPGRQRLLRAGRGGGRRSWRRGCGPPAWRCPIRPRWRCSTTCTRARSAILDAERAEYAAYLAGFEGRRSGRRRGGADDHSLSPRRSTRGCAGRLRPTPRS